MWWQHQAVAVEQHVTVGSQSCLAGTMYSVCILLQLFDNGLLIQRWPKLFVDAVRNTIVDCLVKQTLPSPEGAVSPRHN
jgi:hypothetical protein